MRGQDPHSGIYRMRFERASFDIRRAAHDQRWLQLRPLRRANRTAAVTIATTCGANGDLIRFRARSVTLVGALAKAASVRRRSGGR